MQQIITLKEVAVKIEAWRDQKKFKSQQIPDDLKELIAQLFTHYKASKITKRLKMSGKALYSIKHKYVYAHTSVSKKNNIKTTKVPPMDFIPFRAIDPINNSIPNITSSNCEIIRPDGAKLTINTVSDVSSIIKTFLCSN